MLTRRNNNGLSTYNPFQELDNFERNFFGDLFPRFDRSSLTAFKTDITDEGDSYKIEADLPATGESRLMTAKNKWLIAHPESGLDKDGAFVGLVGENLRV